VDRYVHVSPGRHSGGSSPRTAGTGAAAERGGGGSEGEHAEIRRRDTTPLNHRKIMVTVEHAATTARRLP
jgi:hypothetical protein